MKIFTLTNPHLRMRVSDCGGSILNLEDHLGRPILRPTEQLEPWHPGNSALFPMLPLANRVAGNRFELGDDEYQLPNSPLDPSFFLHGDGWLNCWQVSAMTASGLTLQLSSQCAPFHYLAELDYRLEGPSLRAKLTLTHLGTAPMLYGLGFHPFFCRDELSQIQFTAAGVWLEGDSHLPTQWSTQLEPRLDFRNSARPSGWLNNCYSGWSRSALITQLQGHRTLQLSSNAPFLMLYQPNEDQGFVCLEPQTHAANAHYMAGHPGLQLLDPGASLTLTMVITVVTNQATP